MKPTECRVSARKLRRLLGLERGEGLGTHDIATHDGIWHLEACGMWRFYEDDEVAADREAANG